MDLLHTFADRNRKAFVYRCLTDSYFIRFYEDDMMLGFLTAYTEQQAEDIAEDYVLKG